MLCLCCGTAVGFQGVAWRGWVGQGSVGAVRPPDQGPRDIAACLIPSDSRLGWLTSKFLILLFRNTPRSTCLSLKKITSCTHTDPGCTLRRGRLPQCQKETVIGRLSLRLLASCSPRGGNRSAVQHLYFLEKSRDYKFLVLQQKR